MPLQNSNYEQSRNGFIGKTLALLNHQQRYMSVRVYYTRASALDIQLLSASLTISQQNFNRSKRRRDMIITINTHINTPLFTFLCCGFSRLLVARPCGSAQRLFARRGHLLSVAVAIQPSFGSWVAGCCVRCRTTVLFGACSCREMRPAPQNEHRDWPQKPELLAASDQ